MFNSQAYAGNNKPLNNNNNNNNNSNNNAVKPQTVVINTRYKELYYQAKPEAIKESPRELQNRHVFWNYMMNVSMQNTIVQMSKIA